MLEAGAVMRGGDGGGGGGPEAAVAVFADRDFATSV